MGNGFANVAAGLAVGIGNGMVKNALAEAQYQRDLTLRKIDQQYRSDEAQKTREHASVEAGKTRKQARDLVGIRGNKDLENRTGLLRTKANIDANAADVKHDRDLDLSDRKRDNTIAVNKSKPPSSSKRGNDLREAKMKYDMLKDRHTSVDEIGTKRTNWAKVEASMREAGYGNYYGKLKSKPGTVNIDDLPEGERKAAMQEAKSVKIKGKVYERGADGKFTLKGEEPGKAAPKKAAPKKPETREAAVTSNQEPLPADMRDDAPPSKMEILSVKMRASRGDKEAQSQLNLWRAAGVLPWEKSLDGFDDEDLRKSEGARTVPLGR